MPFNFIGNKLWTFAERAAAARRRRSSLSLAALLRARGGRATPSSPTPPQVPEEQAIEIAAGRRERDRGACASTRTCIPSAERSDSDGDWEVGFFADDDEVVQVVVDDESGEIEESWTGHQVAWRMARGYEGAFGRKLNAPVRLAAALRDLPARPARLAPAAAGSPTSTCW